MTKREQITQTQEGLNLLLKMDVSQIPSAIIPHDRIKTLETAIGLLEEYKKTPCAHT